MNDIGSYCNKSIDDVLRKVPINYYSNIQIQTKGNFVIPFRFDFGDSLRNIESRSLDNVLLREIVIRTVLQQRVERREIGCDFGTIWPEEDREPFVPTNLTYFDFENAMKMPYSVGGISMVRKDVFEIPASLLKMRNLNYIDFSINQIEEIPSYFSGLIELKEVYLSKNRVNSFKGDFSTLDKLRILVLSFNGLKEFPQEITELSQIEFLDLGNNSIEVIPASIGLLKQLKVICLENNLIRKLPKEFFQLTNLKKIYLQGNPLSKTDILELQDKFSGIELVW